MSKIKGDIEIGRRAFEEAVRLFDTPSEASRRIGVRRKLLYAWREGCVPCGIFLAKLHCAGCDVIYILTGKKTSVEVRQ